MRKPKTELLPHEVFEKLDELKNKKERVDFIKQNKTYALSTFLQLNFNDNVKLDLPEGKPPYEADKCPPGLQYVATKNAVRPLGDLVVGSRMPAMRKETTFMAILENLHQKDAEILWRAKDGNISDIYPKVTKALIKEALPELL
jgi:hypothetical protein